MDPITATQPATAGTAPAAGGGNNRQLSSDFETFLTMLTVQLQNQDPLNPVESTDFAVQLATFSGVEQQVQTNDLLSAMAAQMGAGGMAQMAGWVGMEARHSGPVVFDGAPVTLMAKPNLTAERAELVVTDETGFEIQRLPVDPRAEEIAWAGVTSDGAPLPAGRYAFRLSYTSFGQPGGEAAVEHYARVTEVRQDGGAASLVTAGGLAIPVTDVTGVRQPL